MRSLLPICLALAMPLATAPLVAAETSPASIKAGRYTMDRDHRKLIWSVDHLGFSTYYGRLNDFDGVVTLDPAKPAASNVQLTIQMASVATDNDTLDRELKSADWFDAAKFPTATFRSTRVVPGSGGHAQVMGDLTLHGVTKPVMLDVTFHGGGIHPMKKVETVGFDATATLKRSDFGVTKYVPMVSDAVKLHFSAEFQLAK